MARRTHIFIVTGNEVHSMMLDYILSKDNVYRFVNFKSGEECIKNLYLDPNVVVLDYELPGMDGYNTLLEIKKRDPNVHVMMLSNLSETKLVAKLIGAGADDFILKRGHFENEIIARIEKILNTEELEKPVQRVVKRSSSTLKIFYFITISILVTLGIIFLKKMYSV